MLGTKPQSHPSVFSRKEESLSTDPDDLLRGVMRSFPLPPYLPTTREAI